MNEQCGCCEGIHKLTPVSTLNRPGLAAISYRAGTHASFLETMKARLSNMELGPEVFDAAVQASSDPARPLFSLTTRAASDASIAFLDAWALVADVLTFYQERIANEGFLPTAIERRSILELARLVGYRLRPGVAASVFFAYTLEKNTAVEIPVGARAASVPGPGELPQSFETSEKLLARYEWNTLKPRLTQFQVITLASDFGTDAATRETLYFEGISTKLTIGDALLIRLGNDLGQQVLRIIEAVDPQASENRTEVRLVQFEVTDSKSLKSFIDDAATRFGRSKLAVQAADVLKDLVHGRSIALLSNARRRLDELHATAKKRRATNVEPWLDEVIRVVQALSTSDGNESDNAVETVPSDIQLSGFGSLFALLAPLSVTPSIQPASSLRLGRTTGKTFAAQSDIAPQLISAIKPDVAPVLYQAWANVQEPPSQVEVTAIRVKAGLFPGTYPGDSKVATSSSDLTTSFTAPTLLNSWGELVNSNNQLTPPAAIALDGVYDKILPGSWIAIDRPDDSAPNSHQVTYHRVVDVQTRARSTTSSSYSARLTQLRITPDWLDEINNDNVALRKALNAPEILRGTVVYAQAEPLKLAEEPVDGDITGNTIELAELYSGLNSGRWLIVSGERTDIPNVTGVVASELVMLAGITQGAAKEGCVPFPKNVVPFASVAYITEPNAANDRMVVGTLSEAGREMLSNLAIPSVPNQQFCEPVQLAPGVLVDAYVPTMAERNGVFLTFTSLFKGPAPTSLNNKGLFGWRIKQPAGPPQTTLVLASPLAYSYDPLTVTIYGNVVKATHGETKSEVLGSGAGSQEMQQFDLRQAPLTYLSAATPAGAASSLQVRVNDVLWRETDNLVALGPKDRRYVTSTDDQNQTTVQFGNGTYGARLPTGVENVKAVYRVGIGKPGNVKARQITSVVTKPLGVKEVVNPMPATGGADREDRDQARRNVPIAVMSLDRLVSVQDYEDFARTYAGIAKASAARLSDGQRTLVHLTIAGSGDIPIATTSDLFLNLRQALVQFGDPYQGIQVMIRKLKVLVISARVRLLPDYSWEFVEPKIRAAVLDKFSFARRDLGQDALSSEAITIIQGQKGVAYVDLDVFDAIDEDISAQQLANLGSTLQLRPRIVVNKAKIDKTATIASKRILPAELAYLNPAVADTLILTELSP